MAKPYTFAAIAGLIVALLELQNAITTHQSLFGLPMAYVAMAAVLFWMSQKKQRVL